MTEGRVLSVLLRLVAAVVVAAAAPAALARNTALMDPGQITLTAPVGQAASAAKVRHAIVLAGMARGWTIVEEQPGRLKLNFNKGNKHRATIEVRYDERSFGIRYLESYNLDYALKDGQVLIHPNYNRWVNNLAHDTRMIYAQGGAAGILPASAPN